MRPRPSPEEKKQKARERNARYREKHKDRISERIKKWCKDNVKRRQEIRKKWNDANKHRVRAMWAVYRARKLQATPAWADLKKIEQIYKERPAGHEVDHFYPLQSDFVCGLHVPENLQYLPKTVNRSKGNKVSA